jgi:asparagine synthase (glutamine-hydrolysing)
MPELYDNLVSHWRNPAEVVIGGSGDTARFARWGFGVPAVDIARQIMFVDTLTYLPDDILTKVDRATMGASLEGRIPFLDHGVVEFAWRLPFSMKIRDGRSKWILRQVLSRYLPESLVDRPKMGFGVPIGDWLRGPLRDWAEALLDERRIRADGYLRPEPVRRKWSEHSSGSREWQYLLWDVLMFQAWLEEWQGGSSPRHDGGHLRR